MTHRREDTAEGCRAMANDDRGRAAEAVNPHLRASLERSAATWQARAKMLARLEASFIARAEAISSRSEVGTPKARMQISGSIHANLRAALQSARRLRNGPVHPDTVEHWCKIVAVAKADGEPSAFSTRELMSSLEREIIARRGGHHGDTVPAI